jgi:hypothetical protein
MPGKCKFLNKWLEQPQYHAWLRNSPDIHKPHCKCCNKSFDISSMGELALQSHMKGIFIFLFLQPIKTTSLKPGDGITLMRIFDLSGKIPENTVL